jgi:DNA-binding Xre family transcriptional regulator
LRQTAHLQQNYDNAQRDFVVGYALFIGAFLRCSHNGTIDLASSAANDRRSHVENVMGIILRTDTLIREIARRGWNLSDLARAAGISGATVTAARSGRAVSPESVRRIADALNATPPVTGVDLLLCD